MRTLFIGGTRRGYLTLRALIESGAEVVGVLSLRQDEHEVERFEGAIRVLAEGAGVPLFESNRLKDRDYVALLSQQWRPDVAFVVGCRVLIPPEIYEIPPRGTLAVHDSLLPEYRGFAPLNWAILNGESRTGVTLFHLDERMDGGDIVLQREVPIGPDDTAPEVYERVCAATVELVREACPLLASGTAPRIRQDYSVGTFTCSRQPADGWIDWSAPTRAIYNRVRALTYPYPGAWTLHEGRRLTVWRARLLEPSPRYVGRVPGRVVGFSRDDGHADVLTGDGVLRITEVQPEGEPSAKAAEVLKSVRATLGLSPAQLIDRIRDLEQRLASRPVFPEGLTA